jgi:hypothetical protein
LASLASISSCKARCVRAAASPPALFVAGVFVPWVFVPVVFLLAIASLPHRTEGRTLAPAASNLHERARRHERTEMIAASSRTLR